ncbi:uncharacterized protein UTRI_00060 [Ustilago trichophora]|uniref:Zn(2)-C6 fungal-type domain-containing protein n=1 Tax=Ustilago trichophora TaxID=86804 RepID=A0A5C3DQC4_9BASI|nr:uncharacterized protein UTRI_00060 [Ustilago trichophora]
MSSSGRISSPRAKKVKKRMHTTLPDYTPSTSGSPARGEQAIFDWLSTHTSPPRSAVRRTEVSTEPSSEDESQYHRRRGRFISGKGGLPASSSLGRDSSARSSTRNSSPMSMSTFPDEMLEELIALDEGSSSHIPASTAKPAKGKQKARRQEGDWIETCDRCLRLSLECLITSSVASSKACKNCRASHTKCTINGVGVCSPDVAFKIRKESQPKKQKKADQAVGLSGRNLNSSLSSQKRKAGTTIDDGERSLQNSPVVAQLSSRFRKTIAASALASAPLPVPTTALGSASTAHQAALSAYTKGLLVDTKQAIRRCQFLLADPSSLRAMKPTLTLLAEELTETPDCACSPTVSKVAGYMRRISHDCIPPQAASLRSDEVKQSERLLLAKTLFDRCLTLTETLVGDTP